MQSAVVIMSILGCSPQATDCVHLQTMDKRWATVALCDLASANELLQHLDKGYPVLVAVCETPEIFDESEDGHHGKMVTKDGQMLMPGEAAGTRLTKEEQVIRVLMSTQPNKTSILSRMTDAPAKLAQSVWTWVKQQLP
jgi:hypothetical protein